MDGRYLGSGFTERRATSGETADWAYSNPASSSYGATHIETELPLRQSYTSSHTLTTYTTSQHPTGASGVFETSQHTTGGSTAESSVMNFISSVESRGLQAGAATKSLLPQFRTSPWQTGTNTSTELFLTGALPSSGTFPTLSALSSYQHPSTFPTLSFATTSALTVQPTTFSPSNGLLSPHDPLLQMKSSQSTVPTAFAFDRLCSSSLGSGLPIQSSTYRSAQESAPHLLQPQFSLLSSPLTSSQQTTTPYGAPIFSTSIERALQRECSVIKHHQRPSSAQSIQQQLPVSAQHSMQDYLTDDADVSYEDPSRHTPLPNSPNGIAGQAINNTVPQKTTTVQLPQTQTQSPSLPSSGFSSTCGLKAKDDLNKTAEHLGEGSELNNQAVSSPMQQHRYASTDQKQSSVIASQAQPYTSAQLSSLMSVSPSQTYITSQSLISNLNEPRVFSPSQPEKLSSIYKTLPSLSPQSENETSLSHSLIYASGQKHTMSSASNREEYNKQAQRLCMGSAPHSYPSSYSQSLSTVNYYSRGAESTSPSQSYASGQSLAPSPSFSSSYAHNLPPSNCTQDYTQMPPSPNKTDGMLLQQTQKYLSEQSTSSTATYTEAIQNQSVEQNPVYGKRKEDENLFLTTKENCAELPIQEVQALQQASMRNSTQTVTNSVIGVQSNVVYVVSKMEDRQVHSVIRSNSRSDDQLIGLAPMSSMKDERMSILTGQLVSPVHSHAIAGTKNNSTLMQSSQVALSTDQLKEHLVLHKVPTSQQGDQQTQCNRDQRQLSQEQAQFVQLPSAQVLLEPSQMILLQKPLVYTGTNQSKPIQMQPVSVQFLQMNNDILNSTVSTVEIPQITHQALESTKQHLLQKDNFNNSTNHQDAKQHFTLSSICFPDSMLMADERNILSNVDDILAATAAACGVTPQDFKSSSSEGDLASISSPPDSKCHYELVNSKHEANNFPSQRMVSKTQTVTLSVNGGQLTTDFHKEVDGPQAFATSNSHTQQNNSKHEISEEVTNLHKNPKGLNSNEFSLNSNGGTTNPFVNNHTDVHLTSQGYNPTEYEKVVTISKNQVVKSIKIEEKFAECFPDGFSNKKRVRSKGSSKQAAEDDSDQPKSQKRSGQVKRQNSKGSETSSLSASEGCLDSQQQERIWQKIKEVEEKQPEVKTGFIGSFLDFLKSGPKQQFSSLPIRSPNRTRKSSVTKRPFNQLSQPPTPISPSAPMVSTDINSVSSTKRLDEELQKNLETLPSFSSDEDESVGKNQDLQASISSALSSLDEPSDKQSVSKSSGDSTTDTNLVSAQSRDTTLTKQQNPGLNEMPLEELVKNIPLGKLAVCLTTVAIEGLTDEDLSDSGEEGMYRERDEFVVKNEDIESLQVTLKAGIEPPAIWKVQKALLQKFIPELRDGKRVFSATNSYLGYFGDAQTMYRRVYVKFLDTVNKREYVRVCNRKPRCKPMHFIRGSQKSLLAQRSAASAMSDSSASKSSIKQSLSKPRPKQTKAKAEPPPKKRKKWKEEFTESALLSSPEAVGDAPVPFTSRFLNTRTMKETFKGFVELLISVALDADIMMTLERENDELLLPHMKRVDGMITDNRRKLLTKLQVGQVFKNALDSFPEFSVVTELQTDSESLTFKVKLSGKAYNKKTMKPAKSPNKLPVEYTVEQQKTHWFSLYHSLQHYKYHTYLMCRNEIGLLRSRGVDVGQKETVQTCLGNRAWIESLFDRFGELLTQVQQACL